MKKYIGIFFVLMKNFSDYVNSLHIYFVFSSPMRELSNPGASGSIFYLTYDDEFILKTVQVKNIFSNFTKIIFLVIFTKICKYIISQMAFFQNCSDILTMAAFWDLYPKSI